MLEECRKKEVDLAQDVLAAFKGSACVALLPSGGAHRAPEILAMAEMDGAFETRRLSDAVAKLCGGELAEEQFGKYTIMTGQSKSLLAPRPSYLFFRGNVFMFAGTPETLKGILQRDRMGVRGEGIRDREDFRELLARAAAGKASLVYFADLENVARTVAEDPTVAGILKSHDIPSVGSLPVDKLLERLGAWSVTVAAKPDGVAVESVSSVGAKSLKDALEGLVAPIAMRRQVDVDRAIAQAQLGRLFLALNLYAADFDRYPRMLEEVLAGPAYVGQMDPAEAKMVKLSFTYVPGLGAGDVPESIILYESSPVGGARSVLRLDGKVLEIMEKDFKAMLGSQKEW
jgi:hypothetical protein